MPFSVTTLMREPRMFGVGEHLGLDLGGQPGVVLAGQEAGGWQDLQFVMDRLHPLDSGSGLFGLGLEVGARGCPASSTTPLKLVTTMCESLSRAGSALAMLTPTLVSINESSILLPKVRVPRSSSIGASRLALTTEVQPLMPRHRVKARRPRRLGSFFTPEQLAVDQVAKAVDRQQVDFLNTCGDVGRYANLDVLRQKQRRHAAAITTGQCYDNHFAIMCGLDRLNYVCRVAAGGNCQQHIAWLAKARICLEKISL